MTKRFTITKIDFYGDNDEATTYSSITAAFRALQAAEVEIETFEMNRYGATVPVLSDLTLDALKAALADADAEGVTLSGDEDEYRLTVA